MAAKCLLSETISLPHVFLDFYEITIESSLCTSKMREGTDKNICLYDFQTILGEWGAKSPEL